VNIRVRLLIPGIPICGIPADSKELHCATAASGGGIGEADGARLAFCEAGELESEKHLDVVGSVRAVDPGPVAWPVGTVRVGFVDLNADIGAEDFAHEICVCVKYNHTRGQGGEGSDGSDERKLHGW